MREGDIVEVDTILKPAEKRKSLLEDSNNKSQPGSGSGEDADGDGGTGGEVTVRRGRVVVKEIGDRTKKGGYHLTLIRYKHFDIFQRRRYHTIVQQ